MIRHILISCIGVFMLMTSCSGKNNYQEVNGMMWNTTYHITYRSDRNLHDSIIAEMRRVERSLSPFAENSLISAINYGEDVKADSLIHKVFAASLEVNRHSNGAFDPTVAPLINLWGYGYRSGTDPTDEAIDSLLKMTGIQECRIDADGVMIKKHPGTEFNFSAITKGYGCDLVGEMLRRNGCEDYMVEIGGEIAMAGHSPRGRKWRILIDAPIDCDTAVVHEKMALIEVTDCGVATSGNYRNYKVTSEGRTWHTISPVTGRPALTDLLSATIIAPSCMLADAYATACMAQRADSALSMLRSIPDVEGLLVTADTILTTEGFPGL